VSLFWLKRVCSSGSGGYVMGKSLGISLLSFKCWMILCFYQSLAPLFPNWGTASLIFQVLKLPWPVFWDLFFFSSFFPPNLLTYWFQWRYLYFNIGVLLIWVSWFNLKIIHQDFMSFAIDLDFSSIIHWFELISNHFFAILSEGFPFLTARILGYSS